MDSDRNQVFAQGLVAGLIGYLTVALVFAIANLFLGRSPFYTAALLGGALFYHARDLGDVAVVPATVLAYNGVHLLVFLALGMLAAWLAWLAERGPEFWYLSAVLFIFVMFHLLGAFLFFTDRLRAALSVWLVVDASLAAGAAMGIYLLGAHPRLRAALGERSA